MNQTPTGFGNTMDTIRGVANRKLGSWIESFIEATVNLDSPLIYRRWTAISVLAATLSQRVWLQTSSRLYPNLYIYIIGHPGVGKTRTIRVGRRLVQTLSDFYLAPISMTFAAMVDALDAARCAVVVPGQATEEFNSMYIAADELGAFMSKYDREMTDGLAAFYDPDPYRHKRRGNDLDIKLMSPQINMIGGSTPQNLMDFMPEKAWGQGFTSRIIMIFSDERIIGDDFAPRQSLKTEALEHDLAVVANLYGQFHVTAEYRDAVNNWRALGEPPVPEHPKLTHYISRRRAHLYKLSMVSSVDRGNALVLTRDDFNRAMNWLVEAEGYMPDIFKAGATNVDGQAIDEIRHFILAADRGHGVPETKITAFAKDRVPLNSILRVIEIMERSGQIFMKGTERNTGIRWFSAARPEGLAN